MDDVLAEHFDGEIRGRRDVECIRSVALRDVRLDFGRCRGCFVIGHTTHNARTRMGVWASGQLRRLTDVDQQLGWFLLKVKVLVSYF